MQIPAKGRDFTKDEGFALRFGMLGRALAILSNSPLFFLGLNFFFFYRNDKFSPSHFSPKSVHHHTESSWLLEHGSSSVLQLLPTKLVPPSMFPTQTYSIETALRESLNNDLDIFRLRKCQFPVYFQEHYSLWSSKRNLIFVL